MSSLLSAIAKLEKASKLILEAKEDLMSEMRSADFYRNDNLANQCESVACTLPSISGHLDAIAQILGTNFN